MTSRQPLRATVRRLRLQVEAMCDDRKRLLGVAMPRRVLDWYKATRISAGITCMGALATLAYADSLPATQTPISIVDIAVLVGIVTQTVTIGFFAGAISNRLKNLEMWRKEHAEWTNTQAEMVVRRDSLVDINRRLEHLERDNKPR